MSAVTVPDVKANVAAADTDAAAQLAETALAADTRTEVLDNLSDRL